MGPSAELSCGRIVERYSAVMVALNVRVGR